MLGLELKEEGVVVVVVKVFEAAAIRAATLEGEVEALKGRCSGER